MVAENWLISIKFSESKERSQLFTNKKKSYEESISIAEVADEFLSAVQKSKLQLFTNINFK